MAEKLRVHHLADELGVPSKVIIAKCEAEGVTSLKNHMSVVSAGLAESIREWFSEGADVTTVEVAQAVDLKQVRKQRRPRKKAAEIVEEPAPPSLEPPAAPVAQPAPPPEPVRLEPPVAPAAPEPALEPAAAGVSVAPDRGVLPSVEPSQIVPEPPSPRAPEVLTPTAAPTPPEPMPEESLRPAATAAEPAVEAPPPARPPLQPPAAEPPKPPERIVPAGPKLVPRPASLTGPRVVRVEAPEPIRPPRPRAGVMPAPPPAGAPADPWSTPASRKGKRREGWSEEAAGAARAKSPRRRAVDTERAIGERLREWRDQDLLERQERLASATGHGMRARRAAERQRRESGAVTPAARRGDVELTVPIAVKDFCAAISVPFARLLPKLSEHTGRLISVNETLDAETAELMALEFGVNVRIAQQKSPLEELEEEFASRERPNLARRPPVVTMLGHVDHGKTSLLDAIRSSNVVAGEHGGITQHIGAYRVRRDGWDVTFLDTPGHKAFTEMRARGANLTDVAVLVVAADDGVMPQTVEAINHARAANVPIVVALNKIDLPNADVNKIFGELAEHGLTVSEWGGDVDVIRTSATKGIGVDELIAHLSALSELLDLKADPTVPARGTVIESKVVEGRGNVVSVLVQEGTLRPGQTIVCGPAFGRVRSLIDSSGQRLTEAGPGTPVEISGLDELPSAGDRLYQLDDAARAKRVAQQVKDQRRQKELVTRRRPATLEDLFQSRDAAGIPEHNIILRADVDGSIAALRQELGSLPADQVKLNILHAGVGAVSEADVRLAEASHASIIGFHVVPDDGARRLADEVGVEIRTYTVIYDVVADIRKALEGLLEPEIQISQTGKAEVKQVFNLSKVGTVAGCQVTSGTIARGNRLRIVRDGKIIREDAAVASLKRFKNDVKEVAAGYECGIKVEGFDDVKPGDVLEFYEKTEVRRTL